MVMSAVSEIYPHGSGTDKNKKKSGSEEKFNVCRYWSTVHGVLRWIVNDLLKIKKASQVTG